MQKQLPKGWQSGSGEGNRPLSDRGYYMHRYERILPGSNQHVTRMYEMVVDTAGMPPKEHVVAITKRVFDDMGTIQEHVIEVDTVDVENPNSTLDQENAKTEAHNRAEELMEKYSA